MWFRSSLGALKTPSSHTAARRMQRPRLAWRPQVEALEDRQAPAVFTVTDPGDSGPGTLRQALVDAGLRADLDERNEKIGAKIRDAQIRKVPYMLVAGDRESQAGTVAVRSRREGDLGPMSLDAIRGLMVRMQTDRTLGP